MTPGQHAADVIVVGAGAAGLTAAAELGRAGLSVLVLEARNRIGGRMFTQKDPVTQSPIELGAEFIHGLPPEIWRPLQARDILISEVNGTQWCHDGKGLRICDFFSQVEDILGKMDERSPDGSFLSFLKRCCEPAATPEEQEINRRAIAYVSGFNAADPARVGVHWLVQGMQAEKKIEGDRAFRSEHGYDDLLDILRSNVERAGVRIQTHSIVDLIRWKAGHVEVRLRRADLSVVKSRCVLLTLPLGVWQAHAGEEGAVSFEPALPESKLDALRKLEMGKVIRVTFRFKTRFWDSIQVQVDRRKTLTDMSFLLTEDDLFPTWWTTMPRKLPILTGWAPFRSAERLSGQRSSSVIEQGLNTLARILGVRDVTSEFDTAFFHDWQNDPFSRGAYSYGLVGADGAQQALATPVQNTLFFAGEATDTSGHNGTVHGAIASGQRAAKAILARN